MEKIWEGLVKMLISLKPQSFLRGLGAVYYMNDGIF